jgi:hypothetical protein
MEAEEVAPPEALRRPLRGSAPYAVVRLVARGRARAVEGLDLDRERRLRGELPRRRREAGTKPCFRHWRRGAGVGPSPA